MDSNIMRTRASNQGPVKPGGLSVRQGHRAPLGEISNNKPVFEPKKGATKTQGFTIYEDPDVVCQKSSKSFEATTQNENSQKQMSSFGSLRQASASNKGWPDPPKIQTAEFWPPPPPIPTYSSSLHHSIHYEADMGSAEKKPALPPIGSERALSRSLLNSSASSTTSDFPDNIENLVQNIPSYARAGFRQGNDSILSTSPASENYEVSTEDDDSPMVVDGAHQGAGLPCPEDTFDVLEEYSVDIFKHMKKSEQKFLPKWNYMTKQPDITFSMRSILVDWLVEVTEEYKLNTETLFLAVNYIDRFLSFMSVQRVKLQLVGTACMFIAAKYEEIYPPDVSEFCYITDDTYSKKQVLRMEHLILEVLKFECSPPTAHFFSNHLSKLSGCTDGSEAFFLAQYLTELTLMEAETYLHFAPSVISAASVALARHTLGLVAWDSNMIEKTGYRVDDFKACLICLHETFTKAPEFPQQAIREKYKNEKYQMVSQIKPTPIF